MKINSLLWLIKRPDYWQQGLEIIKRRLFYKNDELGKAEAVNWCKTLAVSEMEALALITNQSTTSFKPICEELKDELAKALAIQEQCPVEMGGPGALDFLYHIVKRYKPKRLIETGVAYGWSSWVILQAIKDYEAQLISIDMPYINMDNDKYVGCCVPYKLRKKWVLLRKADRQGIPIALKQMKGGIDFCHYDSDKSYSGRMWAYKKLWADLSSGGLFISDDIQDNIAFKEFCDLISTLPVIVESKGKYAGIIIKQQ